MQCGLDWLRSLPTNTDIHFGGIDNGKTPCNRPRQSGHPILRFQLLLGQGKGHFDPDVKKSKRFPERHSFRQPSAYPSKRHQNNKSIKV